MKTLTVTSPPTSGAHVRNAQLRLDGDNVFRQDYLRGPVDGVFGELTGRACRRAKYWCGYPLATIASERDGPIYGDRLDGYLSGRKPLPVQYRLRRRGRLKPPPVPLGVRALRKLEPHLGLTEQPAGSNAVLFSDWYGMRGPWCAMCVTWAFTMAGSKVFARHAARWAYVPYLVADARAGRHHLQVVRGQDAKPGDLVCYDWQGVGASPYHFDHVGILLRWSQPGRFVAREGNTSSDDRGSQSNGGGLFDRERSIEAGLLFIRVGR